MKIEAPSEDAIELYRVAMRAIALAGIYSAEDVGYAVRRLRAEQARTTRESDDWKAYEHMCRALWNAGMDSRHEALVKAQAETNETLMMDLDNRVEED